MKMTDAQKQYRKDHPEKVLEWKLITYARCLIRNGITDPMSYIRDREAALSEARLTRKTND